MKSSILIISMLFSVLGYSNEKLLDAVNADNLKLAEKILKTDRTVDFEFLNSKFESPLTLAARKGNLEMIKLLVKYKAKINYQPAYTIPTFSAAGYEPHNGFTPLMAAVKAKKTDVVKWLISKNADLNIQKDYSVSSLHVPSDNPLQWKKYRLQDALHLAIENDDSTMVKILVDAGADLNQESYTELEDGQSTDYLTPLMEAGMNGQIKIIKILLAGKADADVVSEEDETAFSYTFNAKYFEICKLLLNSDMKLESINSGAFVESPDDLAQMLLDRGIHAVKSFDGRTALFTAGSMVHEDRFVKRVEQLIAAGADPNFQDGSGETVFHKMAKKEFYGTDEDRAHDAAQLTKHFQIIISTSLPLNLELIDTYYQNTSLIQSVSSYYWKPEMARGLLLKGANGHYKNRSGESAYSLLNERYRNATAENRTIIRDLLKLIR